MQSTAPSSEYGAPDDFPLDEESMVFLMESAGWAFDDPPDGSAMLVDPKGRAYRVPADELGRTLHNAFKIYIWTTKHPPT
jgi:hypothetical protein